MHPHTTRKRGFRRAHGAGASSVVFVEGGAVQQGYTVLAAERRRVIARSETAAATKKRWRERRNSWHF